MAKKDLGMLILLLTCVGLLYNVPMAMNVYSPLPAAMAPWEKVHVGGIIMNDDGSFVAGVEVVLFGTDELIKDVVVTNDVGYFVSSIRFESGQVITVTVDGVMLYVDHYNEPNVQAFIGYDAVSDSVFDLGVFVIPDVNG